MTSSHSVGLLGSLMLTQRSSEWVRCTTQISWLSGWCQSKAPLNSALNRVKRFFKAYSAPICTNNSDGKLNLSLSMLLGEQSKGHEDLMKPPLAFARIFRLRFSMRDRCLKIHISKPGRTSQNTFLQLQAHEHCVKLWPSITEVKQ